MLMMGLNRDRNSMFNIKEIKIGKYKEKDSLQESNKFIVLNKYH